MDGTYEHPSSPLGHSEELSVENPVGPPVPEFCQATEERPKISAAMTGEESRYVLEEDGGRSVLLHKVKEGEGETAALSGEPGPLAGDGEVLAREAAGPEGGVSSVVFQPCGVPDRGRKANDVAEIRDSGPSFGEDGAGVGVNLGEADGAPSGTFKPKVESSDS